MPREQSLEAVVDTRPSGARRDPALRRSQRLVVLSLALQVPETAALGAAAIATGSSALVAQAFAAAADLAVQVFLLLGVRFSAREADLTHPVGYGRERYFWALYAAIGVFVSGFTVAILEAVRSAVRSDHLGSFAIGYAVLAVSFVFSGAGLMAALGEVRKRHHGQLPIRHVLGATTDPAIVTELIGNGIGVAGSALSIVALALAEATGSHWPDTIASALIGLALMAAAVSLTQLNRSLMTGRGVHRKLLEEMRAVIAAQPGIIDVPDLFAVVVGPSTLTVNGDVTFDQRLSVSEVESALERAAAELRARWPEVGYVYLTLVGQSRPRGGGRSRGDGR